VRQRTPVSHGAVWKVAGFDDALRDDFYIDVDFALPHSLTLQLGTATPSTALWPSTLVHARA
jgi:hypothetical protein